MRPEGIQGSRMAGMWQQDHQDCVSPVGCATLVKGPKASGFVLQICRDSQG